MKMKRIYASSISVFMLLAVPFAVFAHASISPQESTAGAIETYTIKVPTERDSATVRIEVELPAGVTVSEVGTVEGWATELTKDSAGQLRGAVWNGGSIAPKTSESFKFTVQNPRDATTLIWKVIQIHADGSKAEWIGEPGSKNPAPRVEVGKH